MAYYLVRATPRTELLDELRRKLGEQVFVDLRPFGHALTQGLTGARWEDGEGSGTAIWEEEDYCTPPLAMERAAVLDRYFDDIRVEHVARGEGWQRIRDLAPLFPNLAAGR
jgi:hypothetical protein